MIGLFKRTETICIHEKHTWPFIMTLREQYKFRLYKFKKFYPLGQKTVFVLGKKDYNRMRETIDNFQKKSFTI